MGTRCMPLFEGEMTEALEKIDGAIEWGRGVQEALSYADGQGAIELLYHLMKARGLAEAIRAHHRIAGP